MSVKDIKKYHLRMTADYMELKEVLKQLEEEITPETSSEALKNIEIIKQRVNKLQENFNRINYIIYLLNMPNKKDKRKKYEKQHEKQLNKIPEKDRLEGIHKENKQSINFLNDYLEC